MTRLVIWKYSSPPPIAPRSTRVNVTLKNATKTPATATISRRHHRQFRTRQHSQVMSGVSAAHTYHSVAAIVSVYRQRGGW